MKYSVWDVAVAFNNGIARVAGNAVSTGEEYLLFGKKIAMWHNGAVIFHWCGYYTRTTADHMNNILRALGAEERVSYATARDESQTVFTVKIERN